jgi:lipoprotein-anchoring transpeptidase ErfK/SrfK
MSARVRTAFGAVALAVVVAGCGGSSGVSQGQSTTKPDARKPGASPSTTTPAYVSTVAQVVTDQVSIYKAPQTGDGPTQVLANPWRVEPSNPATAVPQVFLVTGQRPGWVQVLLPVRPNGSTGWIPAAQLQLRQTSYRIVVSLSRHQITVTNANDVVYQGPVAIGTADTPTPTGSFYLRVLIRAVNPNTVYGPYAYGLSSHSDALDTFNGGDAEIGIHGNDDASVLGKNVTHGCIRMDNAAITMLATGLPLGTPVRVVA